MINKKCYKSFEKACTEYHLLGYVISTGFIEWIAIYKIVLVCPKGRTQNTSHLLEAKHVFWLCTEKVVVKSRILPERFTQTVR